jgi:Helix-turn-helix of DDE superfamily endonuclease
MKLSYGELQGKPRILQSLTGLKRDEFEVLLESFGRAWEDFVNETFQREGRKRAYGAGRKPHLKQLDDKLLFILVYFRLYPTPEVQGFLFGMGQAQANEWVHRLTGLLNRALGYEHQLPEREPAKLEAVLKRCPSLEFMIDGTERPMNRPKIRSTASGTIAARRRPTR